MQCINCIAGSLWNVCDSNRVRPVWGNLQRWNPGQISKLNEKIISLNSFSGFRKRRFQDFKEWNVKMLFSGRASKEARSFQTEEAKTGSTGRGGQSLWNLLSFLKTTFDLEFVQTNLNPNYCFPLARCVDEAIPSSGFSRATPGISSLWNLSSTTLYSVSETKSWHKQKFLLQVQTWIFCDFKWLTQVVSGELWSLLNRSQWLATKWATRI